MLVNHLTQEVEHEIDDHNVGWSQDELCSRSLHPSAFLAPKQQDFGLIDSTATVQLGAVKCFIVFRSEHMEFWSFNACKS